LAKKPIRQEAGWGTATRRVNHASAALMLVWILAGCLWAQADVRVQQRDTGAYRRWGRKTLREDVELFENQILYLIQIRKLKNRVFQEQRVTITEEEMQQVFLKDKHHVGGELVVFALTILSGSRAEIFPYFLSDLGLIRDFLFFVGLFVVFCPFLSLRMTSQLFKIP